MITEIRPTERLSLPTWVLKLARRLLALQDGRYAIILSRDGGKADWSVMTLGKIEHS